VPNLGDTSPVHSVGDRLHGPWALRHPNIKADTETIRKSLEGNWRPEHSRRPGEVVAFVESESVESPCLGRIP
jgi:hypothetical protein